MKSFNYQTYALAVVLCVIQYTAAFSQTEGLEEAKYPFVTKDIAGDYITGDGLVQTAIRLALPIPGAWGASVSGEFLKRDMVYASMEAGYGWSLSADKNYTKTSGMWFNIQAGYPIFYFKRPKKGKWVVHQESVYARNRSGTRSEYFRVAVPNHRFVILEAGYFRNLYSHQSNSLDNGTAGVSMMVVAPAFRVGIKHKAYSSAHIRVKDRDSGTVYSGTTRRISEFYLGFVFPAASHVGGAPENFNELPKDKPGVEIGFKIPAFLNGFATFDVGIRSVGYGGVAQLYIGNTIHLK